MSVAVIDKTADAGGLRVAYREAGAGKTIVFLHGAGGAPPKGALFPALLGERHRVLIPSQPGFDATRGSEKVSVRIPRAQRVDQAAVFTFARFRDRIREQIRGVKHHE